MTRVKRSLPARHQNLGVVLQDLAGVMSLRGASEGERRITLSSVGLAPQIRMRRGRRCASKPGQNNKSIDLFLQGELRYPSGLSIIIPRARACPRAAKAAHVFFIAV
jgi:hypothetical protein